MLWWGVSGGRVWETKKTLPLEFSDTPGANDDHGRLHIVDDVKQHVPGVLGMPGLTGDDHVELGPLQKAGRLPYEDVSQALALLRD